jgi:pyridoxamine 5'-phosphate oxidase
MATSVRWRDLIQCAMEVGGHAPSTKFVQLATLTKDGLPSVRTVVFRGWLNEESMEPVMKFTSDLRSEKVTALASRENWSELCWYFHESRDQFRLCGNLRAVGPSATEGSSEARARVAQWQDLSDAARLQYCFPAPGLARRERSAEGADPFQPSQPSATDPMPTFGLLLFCPTQVDYYSTRAVERNIYTRVIGENNTVQAWTCRRVNP